VHHGKIHIPMDDDISTKLHANMHTDTLAFDAFWARMCHASPVEQQKKHMAET